MTQLRLTKADAKNRANILWTRLSTVQQCYGSMIDCYNQIQQAFTEKHIGLKQYDELMSRLGAIQAEVLPQSYDRAKVVELSKAANELRSEALELVRASRNAAQGWRNDEQGRWQKGIPYEIKKLK